MCDTLARKHRGGNGPHKSGESPLGPPQTLQHFCLHFHMAFTSSRTVLLVIFCLVMLLVVHLQRASSQHTHGGNGFQVNNYKAEALGSGANERPKYVLKSPNSNAATAVARRKKRQPLASFPNPSDEGSSGPNLDPAASGGVWTRWKRLAAKPKSSPFRL